MAYEYEDEIFVPDLVCHFLGNIRYSFLNVGSGRRHHLAPEAEPDHEELLHPGLATTATWKWAAAYRYLQYVSHALAGMRL